MSELPPKPPAPETLPPPPSNTVSALTLLAIASALSLLVIWLRPQSEPVSVIAGVFAAVAAIMALRQTNETHRIVNSQLEQWKRTFTDNARRQGVEQGTSAEQARVEAMKQNDKT